MKNWNGKEIRSAHSKGKGCIQIVAHPFDNLMSTGCSPWPTPEVLQKLYKSGHGKDFEGDQLKISEEGVGYYCDLQSLNSEDAITWSVFGTVARARQSQKESWVADLFALLKLSKATSYDADIFLWRRIPHPDTLVSGGPEIDFGILTRNALVIGEAKWRSPVNKAQGKSKNKSQIKLREEFVQKYGRKLYPSQSVFAVVGISLSPDTFKDTSSSGTLFKTAVWDDVCALSTHPHANEVKSYLEWKKKHSRI